MQCINKKSQSRSDLKCRLWFLFYRFCTFSHLDDFGIILFLPGILRKMWFSGYGIVDLIREGAITLDDLAGFSEELQAQVQFFI